MRCNLQSAGCDHHAGCAASAGQLPCRPSQLAVASDFMLSSRQRPCSTLLILSALLSSCNSNLLGPYCSPISIHRLFFRYDLYDPCSLMFFHKRKPLDIRHVRCTIFTVVLVITRLARSTPTGNDCKVSELLDEKVTKSVLPLPCPCSIVFHTSPKLIDSSHSAHQTRADLTHSRRCSSISSKNCTLSTSQHPRRTRWPPFSSSSSSSSNPSMLGLLCKWRMPQHRPFFLTCCAISALRLSLIFGSGFNCLSVKLQTLFESVETGALEQGARRKRWI